MNDYIEEVFTEDLKQMFDMNIVVSTPEHKQRIWDDLVDTLSTEQKVQLHKLVRCLLEEV